MAPRSLIAKVILSVFILAALFGVYGMISFSHAEHGGCPLSSVTSTFCASPLEHLGHWQAVFTAVFAETLVLFALVAVFFGFTALHLDALRKLRGRCRDSAPRRPTLLQELFSQGILHRKEPLFFR